jgi:serine protease Do
MRWHSGAWASGIAAIVLVLGMGVASAATGTKAEPKAQPKEGWLGVYSQTLTPELREGLNYSGSGALVNRVVDGSPAAKAGVKSSDVIVGINTTTVASATDLTKAIQAMKVGQAISVRIVRDGARRSLSATLAERPEESLEWIETPDGEEAPEAPGSRRYKDGGDFEYFFDEGMPGLAMFSGGRGRLGVRIENLSPDLGSYFGVADGKGVLVLEVFKETPAEKAGLKAGDVITKAGDRKVEDSDDLVSALRDSEKKVTLTVMRQKASRTIESELRERPSIRIHHDGPMSFRDGDVRIRRVQRDIPDDVRRELDDLRRELRDLKTKLEEDKNRN